MGFLATLGVTMLRFIGFAVVGPVVGSIAAIIQAIFFKGTIRAGSWFARAQSVAMTSRTP
jgi:hypothetical protein